MPRLDESASRDHCILQVARLARHDSQSGKTLLTETSLDVHGGDRIGLVGASGSGKSTLLRGIAMLDRCDGEVHYFGNRVRGDDVPDYRRKVVYLPQRPSFVLGSALENLLLPFEFAASSRSIPNTFARADAEQAIVELGLTGEILDQPADSLSGGEQQLVALARALSLHPHVLLLDEPTAALDGGATSRFEERILQWHSGNPADDRARRAFLWTSHDPAQVHRLTDRVMTMDSGVLQTSHPAEQQGTSDD